jgi:hypothetical protein
LSPAASTLEGRELERRRGAWDALSFLFLDAEVRDWLPGAAVTLVELGYSRDEIEGIFLDEVTPVLHGNLKQVAGLWSGFDLDWLASEIKKRKPAPAPRSFGRFRRLLYRMRAWPATDEFDALLNLFDDARSRPTEARRPWARALSVLVASYFERPGDSARERHLSELIESHYSDAELRALAGDAYRIFGPLRVRALDRGESVGRTQVDALLAAVANAR